MDVLQYYVYGSVFAVCVWTVHWIVQRSVEFGPNPLVAFFDLMGGIITAALFWPILLWRAIWGN